MASSSSRNHKEDKLREGLSNARDGGLHENGGTDGKHSSPDLSVGSGDVNPDREKGEFARLSSILNADVKLKPHQTQCLAWMLLREQQTPPGGIVADDMGLGKTLTMLSLIALKKSSTGPVEAEVAKLAEAYPHAKCYSHGTLVVAPASLVHQWKKEVTDKVRPGVLNVYVFHGPKYKRETDPGRLANYDVVLTTYELVKSELKQKHTSNAYGGQDDSWTDSDDDLSRPAKDKRVQVSNQSRSPLAQVVWDRVVLDEAHTIKNRHAIVSRACCLLAAVNRWCLTGTPIHNALWDLYSLVRFLRVQPYASSGYWMQYIMESSAPNTRRLKTLVDTLMIRRTKDQKDAVSGKPIVALKSRFIEDIHVFMTDTEAEVYGHMMKAIKKKTNKLLEKSIDDQQTMSSILVQLLRLRQAAVHMYLTACAADQDAVRNEWFYGDDGFEDSFGGISQNNVPVPEYAVEASASIGEELRKKPRFSAVFEADYKSAKIRAIEKRLNEIVEAGDKCVIVSQWTSVLELIERHLRSSGIRMTSITGKVAAIYRQERMNSFNAQDGSAQVMLLSLAAGGVGLNLTGANHLFLVDFHWNPALEQQACDRIYRMGQMRDVHICRFVCAASVEERVLELQKKKQVLAASVLSGATSTTSGRLSMDDLQFIFGPDLTGTTTVSRKLDPTPGGSGLQKSSAARFLPASRLPTVTNNIVNFL